MKSKKFIALCVSTLLTLGVCQAATLRSEHAIVVSDDTGQVLLSKSSNAIVPIASLTKLMTAMVILDSKPDMDESISIQASDVDVLKHSKSHVPVGTTLKRREIFELALMSPDNRAAASLARTYPGSTDAFLRAVQEKIKALGLHDTTIKEPTGLSPENTSSAADLAKMARAAAQYPQIVNTTTDKSEVIRMNGRPFTVNNTNRLVGAVGWDVQLSKTGFTNEAGHCLIMRIKQAGSHATLVLLNAGANSIRLRDAAQIRQYLAGPRALWVHDHQYALR